MKHILKHIVTIYLAFFMLLASMAIPYSAMTCKVTNTKSIAFLDTKFDCQEKENDSSCNSVNKEACLEKSACCLFDSGIIEADADLVVSNTIEFQAFVAYIKIPQITFESVAKYTNNYPLLVEVEKSDQAIRILHQSFLC